MKHRVKLVVYRKKKSNKVAGGERVGEKKMCIKRAHAPETSINEGKICRLSARSGVGVGGGKTS